MGRTLLRRLHNKLLYFREIGLKFLVVILVLFQCYPTLAVKNFDENFCDNIIGNWKGEQFYPEFNAHQAWVATYNSDGSSLVTFTTTINKKVSTSEEVSVWSCVGNIIVKHDSDDVQQLEPTFYELLEVTEDTMRYLHIFNEEDVFEYIAHKIEI
jgi:hypothetical protein